MQACPQAHVYNPSENTAREFLNEKFENPIKHLKRQIAEKFIILSVYDLVNRRYPDT